MEEKKAHRGRLWEMLGMYQSLQGMWEYFSFFRAKAKKRLQDAKKEKQEGIQSQWHQEFAAKEVLEQVRRCVDTNCSPKMMKFGFFALKEGNWEEYKRRFRNEEGATDWAFERTREAFEKSGER